MDLAGKVGLASAANMAIGDRAIKVVPAAAQIFKLPPTVNPGVHKDDTCVRRHGQAGQSERILRPLSNHDDSHRSRLGPTLGQPPGLPDHCGIVSRLARDCIESHVGAGWAIPNLIAGLCALPSTQLMNARSWQAAG